MPELPEVETIRRDLDPELRGRSIERVRVYHDDLILGGMNRRTFSGRIRDRRILGVRRRAKYLLFDLAPDLIVRVQLRMSGRFWLGSRRPDPQEFRHPGIDLRLDDGRTLFYDDTRRLGGFDVLEPETWAAAESRIGPEPLPRAFTWRVLADRLEGARAPIKNALLDQRRLAGVGNIYASEALYRSGIDPRRAAGSLSESELRRLHREVRAVLREALRSAGTTFQNYRAVNGRSGSFQTRLHVYARDGSPCPRCGRPVTRIIQAGRSTFFCETCQS
ncbi:MAG: bifunctional DNA-formamidopyrimidine glycosylase/DNA-(apurinic or apyrimidinic site) lyase [Gemmatimonadota bacterium]|nr:bifunctional DNA-formamidopyrimidine glycosylase/DNA-(apurinic or apyrimidinic site) lyase [Gemmatimonadota bacterium]